MNTYNIHLLQKIFLLVSILFASITLGYEILFVGNNEFPEGQNNIVFVLDVSQSMNVIDMGGYSRIDAAKRKIIDIVRETQGNNYALNIFAGESLRVLPFTTDIGLISTFLLGLDSRNITKQGSNIQSALMSGKESFNPEQSGKVILFTDGSDEEIIISKELKDLYEEQNIKLIILGVGTSEGGYIPSNSPLSPYKMYNGSIVTSRLNSENLKGVTETNGGEYLNIQEYLDYSGLGKPNKTKSFPYIFILFIMSWILYLLCIYKNIFSKNTNLGNIK